jgi:hypothetical protein
VGTGPGRRRACGIATGVVLVALSAGCAQSVPGTPHPEGEGPTTSSGTGAEAAPPTDFQEPSGRPTVTVEPDQTEPMIPGPLSTAPPPSSSAAPSPTSARSAPAPDRSSGSPLAAAPTGTDRSGGSGTAGSSGGGSGSGGSGSGGSGSGSGGSGSGAGAPAAPAAPANPGRAAPAAQPALLTSDVLDDECLLDASGFAALLGGPVGKPAEAAVIRPDGSTTRSCYAASRAGDPAGTAAVNVYRVNQGTPAAFVRATAGGRPMPGVGEAAVLLETVGGTTLQVATARYLITVNVVDAAPSTERWAAAGRAVAAAVARP